jgi:glycosyltransferase involved in cell wall biosynthesis
MEVRNRKRLIYSSTPFRGLSLLPELFTRIQAVHQDAELHIFSGFKVYEAAVGQHEAMERQWAATFDALRQTPGCFVHGNVTQPQLAKEFMRCGILAYPNTFDETSCISVMEAMAGGCAPITSRRGALPETVGDAGILIDDPPGSAAYKERFVASVVNLLSDERAWSTLSLRSLARAEGMSWDVVAQDLTKRLQAD